MGKPVSEPLLFDGNDKLLLRWHYSRLETLHLRQPTRSEFCNVKLPAGTKQVFHANANPQGDKIAWYVGIVVKKPSWIEKMIRFVRMKLTPGSSIPVTPPTVDTEGIWISKVDGTGMRPVGEVVAEWAPVGMGSFTWCPDGRHVLITYRNGIYKVPVD